MPSIKEINELFKAGRYDEAYSLALNDLQCNPDNVWEQRKMGWALSNMMKYDAEKSDSHHFIQHLNDLLELNQLSYSTDQVLFESILWRIVIAPLSDEQCSMVWEKLKHIDFVPSVAYSAYLRTMLKHKQWVLLEDFVEWWNFSKLQEEDYDSTEFVNENGKMVRMMPLAEWGYITYARLLLAKNDLQKINSFIPQMEWLCDTYPRMTYPGYFCGKLLLAMDADDKQTLLHLIPFVRKKSRDFWAWQLLSEVFDEDIEKQMACLLRATICCQKEVFLVKVRTALAQLLFDRGDFARARFHLNTVVKTYHSSGWKIPLNLASILKKGEIQNISPDSSAPMDFMSLTDTIAGLSSQNECLKQKKALEILKGVVTSNRAHTALFVSGDSRYAFIPNDMRGNLKVGDRVIARVFPSFDKKKEAMGLRCASVQIDTSFQNVSHFYMPDNFTEMSDFPRFSNPIYEHYESIEDWPF